MLVQTTLLLFVGLSASMSADLRIRSANSMAKAAALTPFDDEELDRTIAGLQSLAGSTGDKVDWQALRALYQDTAHKNYKDWATTEVDAASLQAIVSDPSDAAFKAIFSRVLDDGNFGAAAAAADVRSTKPWICLVSGLNGIRKTTSVHQPWFQSCLAQALAGQSYEGPTADLPNGKNAFFRQLDYMLTTLAIVDFEALFEIADVGSYAEVKAGIFARYRTAAEMLGVLLVKAAQKRRSNIMVETSGRDIGMYTYVDHLFPDDAYNKLVCHFSINDIAFAERSVDTRMLNEMADGRAALAAQPTAGLNAIIRANAGGPYGSQVLQGIKADSDAVWAKLRSGEAGGVAGSWFKASIAIEARDDADWTARAVVNGEPSGDVFTFQRLG